VAFIKHGEVLRIDELNKLAAAHTTVRIRARGATSEVLNGLNAYAMEIHHSDEEIVLTVPDESSLPEIARYLITNDVSIYSIQPERVTLEDLFLQVVGTDGGL
jgi:ABC-2 type transport system ATP-binding protein